MQLLALEASTPLLSLALWQDGTLTTAVCEQVQQHAENLLPLVADLLKQGHAVLGECDAIAYAQGPGGFTGLRVGCAVAQGLAFGSGVPMIGVCNLEMLAEAAFATAGASRVLAMLDARMSECYLAAYERREDGEWTICLSPALVSPHTLPNILAGLIEASGVSAHDWYAVGSGAVFLTEDLPIQAALGASSVVPHAAHLATCALRLLRRGDVCAPAEASLVYLRNQVAQTTAERLAAKANKAHLQAQGHE